MIRPVKLHVENNENETLYVCFEPGGASLPISPKTSVEIDLTTDGTPLRMVFEKHEGRSYIGLWEEKGCRYSVRYKGKSIDLATATAKD